MALVHGSYNEPIQDFAEHQGFSIPLQTEDELLAFVSRVLLVALHAGTRIAHQSTYRSSRYPCEPWQKVAEL